VFRLVREKNQNSPSRTGEKRRSNSGPLSTRKKRGEKALAFQRNTIFLSIRERRSRRKKKSASPFTQDDSITAGTFVSCAKKLQAGLVIQAESSGAANLERGMWKRRAKEQ